MEGFWEGSIKCCLDRQNLWTASLCLVTDATPGPILGVHTCMDIISICRCDYRLNLWSWCNHLKSGPKKRIGHPDVKLMIFIDMRYHATYPIITHVSLAMIALTYSFTLSNLSVNLALRMSVIHCSPILSCFFNSIQAPYFFWENSVIIVAPSAMCLPVQLILSRIMVLMVWHTMPSGWQLSPRLYCFIAMQAHSAIPLITPYV